MGVYLHIPGFCHTGIAANVFYSHHPPKNRIRNSITLSVAFGKNPVKSRLSRKSADSKNSRKSPKTGVSCREVQ